jgi:hypothetical protein
MDHHDLHGVVSCVALADLPALEDGARALGATVLHADVSGATGEASLLAAIAQALDLGDAARNWSWDSINDLLWQRLHGAGETVLVLAGVDALLPGGLQVLLDATGALRDLSRSVAPTPLWNVLAGSGSGFPSQAPGM